MANVEFFVDRFRRLAVYGFQASFILGALFGMVTFSDLLSVTLLTGASLVLSVVSLLLARFGNVPWAVAILSMQFIALPYALSLAGKGIYDVAMLMAPAGIIAVGVLQSTKRTALFAALTVIGAVVVSIASSRALAGAEFSAAMEMSISREAPIAALIIAFAAGVGVLISSGFSHLVETIKAQNARLEAAVELRTHELQCANDDLRQALEAVESSAKELVRNEKMAALGGVVAGVTHELSTPIGNALLAASTIADNVASLRARVAAGGLKRSDFEHFVEDSASLGDLIVRSLERANDLTRSFKRVSVDQSSERRRPFLLGEAIQDVVRTVSAGLGSRAPQCFIELDKDRMLDSFPGAFSQVLSNLLQNSAVHAFEGRAPGVVRIQARALDDDRIELRISDNGCGIPDALIEEVFRPFFTTGAERGGSGLGLPICRSLVTSLLGGSIDVESREGEGTSFIIRLPVLAPPGVPNA